MFKRKKVTSALSNIQIEMKRTVWEQGSMSSTLEDTPPPELIEHTKDVILGTPGGLQYHHTTAVEKLKKMDNVYILFLRRSGIMMGSIGYVERKAHTGERTHQTWLIRYFSMKAPMRSEKKAKVKRRPLESRAFSMLKDITHIFHENPERLRDFDTKELPQSLSTGLVEKNNARSRNFAEIGGYKKIGDVETFMFSRMRARKNIEVELLPVDEQPEMRKVLKEFYKDHAIYHDDYIFNNNDYYVLRENGEIIAGLQANRETWKIKTTGNNFLDKLFRVLSKLSFVKKRLSYDDLRFLGIEGIYFKEGRETDVYKVLEGVLAKTEYYLALLVFDVKSPVYEVFKKKKKLGPVNAAFGTFDAELYGRFYKFPEEEEREIIERPKYYSIYDNT